MQLALPSAASVTGLSPGGLSAPRHSRPVSYYALFQGWLLLSQPPGCLRAATTLPTEPVVRDLSRRSGLFPSRRRIFAPAVSRPAPALAAFVVWFGSVSGKPPRRSSAIPPRRPTRGLHLNAFRGEPAISGFAWHFTATHSSSGPFATDLGSALHRRVPPASAWPWVDHPVSGRSRTTHRPFGLAFAPAPPVPGLASPPGLTRRLILQKARRHPACAGLRPAGSAWFQDLFHSPRRGAFHRSLTVLVHYRSLAVFSLGAWSPLLPAGFRVSGGTHDLGSQPSTRGRLRDSHPLR